MTPLLPNSSQLCWFCRKKPASVDYSNPGGMRTERVCGTCRDRLEVQDALESLILQTFELEENEKYDEILSLLDDFHAMNSHKDHDGWLAQSIAMHKSSTLYDAGRFTEAEQACEAWRRIGFADVSLRWLHAVIAAKTLVELARPAEAIAVLEEALNHRDPKYFPSVHMVLENLAEISEMLARPVDEKWRPLAEELAAFHGVPLPVHESLGRTILELVEISRAKQS